jgi:hypothetical protein
MLGLWPFSFGKKKPNENSNDNRAWVTEKGAKGLFLKFSTNIANGKALLASAFRTGTGGVATAVSTLHTCHEWEGIPLKLNEAAEYESNPEALKNKFFHRVEEFDKERAKFEDPEARALVDALIDSTIKPLTLKQGK